MPRKISYAQLHGTELHVPGIGQIGKTLPVQGKISITTQLELNDKETGIEMTVGGVKAFIPLQSVFGIVFAQEKPLEAKVVVKSK